MQKHLFSFDLSLQLIPFFIKFIQPQCTLHSNLHQFLYQSWHVNGLVVFIQKTWTMKSGATQQHLFNHLSIYHLFRFLNMQFLDDLFYCKIPINHNKNWIYSIFSANTEQMTLSNWYCSCLCPFVFQCLFLLSCFTCII